MAFVKTHSSSDFDYKKLILQLNGKFASYFNNDRSRKEPDAINPFVYAWNIPWYQWLKMTLIMVTLMPLRVVGFTISFGIAYLLSFIALYNNPDKDINNPMQGWRKNIVLPMFCFFARIVYFCGSIHWIKVKGVRSTIKEASILVLAPHSAFIDSLFVVFLGMNSVIGKTESADSCIGYLLRLTQPILVSREDPNSRQNTIDKIKKRCFLSENWPQMLIFPEGTCTNRSCLINFKTGAFIPGCPVQPVVLRWPNKVDCITWTWDGPGVWTLLWMLFCQVHTFVEIEFLPVYRPTEDEKRNPKLFADNVRAVMAKALNIPTTNHSYEDCRHMTLAKKYGLPFSEIVVEFSRLQKRLLFLRQDSVSMLQWLLEVLGKSNSSLVSITDLCHCISMTDNEALVDRIFRFYDKNNIGVMDMRDLFCHLCLYSFPFQRKLALKYIMKAYHQISESTEPPGICHVLQKAFMLTPQESSDILSFIKSHHSSGQSYLSIMNTIMNMMGGPFNMYSDYYTAFNKSTKSSAFSCSSNGLTSNQSCINSESKQQSTVTQPYRIKTE